MKLGDFSPKDLVKVKFMSAMLDGSMRVLLTMSELVPPGAVSNKLGPIADDELPCHYRSTTESKGYDYDRVLHSLPEFKNPGNVRVFTKALLISTVDDDSRVEEGDAVGEAVEKSNSSTTTAGASTKHAKELRESLPRHRSHASFMRGLNGLVYPQKEMAFALAKAQYGKWALESVSKGVDEFKAGNTTAAMLSLNRALSIDADNVEGLVARGVCQASSNFLRKAIEDFEKALGINPHHHNAKKFLSETLMAYGGMLTERGELDKAKEIYTKVIQLKPKDQGGGDEDDDPRDRIAKIDRRDVDESSSARRKSLSTPGMRSDMSPRSRDGVASSPGERRRSGKSSRGEEEGDGGGEGGSARRDETASPQKANANDDMQIIYEKYDLVGDSLDGSRGKKEDLDKRQKEDEKKTTPPPAQKTPPKQERDEDNANEKPRSARKNGRSRSRSRSKSRSRRQSRGKQSYSRSRKSKSRSQSRRRSKSSSHSISRRRSKSGSRDRRARSSERGQRSRSRSGGSRSASRKGKTSASRSDLNRTSGSISRRDRRSGSKSRRSRSGSKRGERSGSRRGQRSRSGSEKDGRSKSDRRKSGSNERSSTRQKNASKNGKDSKKEEVCGPLPPPEDVKLPENAQQQQHPESCNCWRCFERRNGIPPEELELEKIDRLKRKSLGEEKEVTADTKADTASTSGREAKVVPKGRQNGESSSKTSVNEAKKSEDKSGKVWVEKKSEKKRASSSSSSTSSSSSSSSSRQKRRKSGGGKNKSISSSGKRDSSSAKNGSWQSRRTKKNQNGKNPGNEKKGDSGKKSIITPTKGSAANPPEKQNKALLEMESFLQTLKNNKQKGIAGTATEKVSGSGSRSGGGPVIRRTFKDPLTDLTK